jgi:glycosyltransferase involved in cell wall biosynthesis
MPLISVIIPMRNGEPFVAETLRSVLGQTGVDLDVVVVNDGSTDASPDTVRAFNDPRVRLIDGPCRGISAAVNAGLAAARGDYWCRCDADDLYPAGRLAAQAAYLDSHPDVGAVCGGYSLVDSKLAPVRPFVGDGQATDVTAELLGGVGRSHLSAYLFRTPLLRQIGGCREWFATSEDADLQFRFAETARVVYQAVDVYTYRLHDASITHAQADARRVFYSECATTFLKQRRETGRDDLQRGTPPAPPQSGDKPRSTKKQIIGMLLGDAWQAHARGDRGRAVTMGLKAVRYAPASLACWKSFVNLLLKPPGKAAS